ncbi:MAG: tyrosine-protein phosphatase [Culicoidibacterales bacterium]
MTTVFNKIGNFRDLGGYKSQNGQIVKHRALLRSGELHELTANDIKILEGTYFLEHIIDMRTTKEILTKPDSNITNANYHHVDMFDPEDKNSPPSLEELITSSKNCSPTQYMQQIYHHLITSPTAQKSYCEFFYILLNANSGACLWHCFAGKDRTGLGSALVLSILNVSSADIISDYLETNSSRHHINQHILQEMAAKKLPQSQIDYLRILLTVEKSYLSYSIAVIKENYGSLENYITNILKIPKADQRAFQQKYLIDE